MLQFTLPRKWHVQHLQFRIISMKPMVANQFLKHDYDLYSNYDIDNEHEIVQRVVQVPILILNSFITTYLCLA